MRPDGPKPAEMTESTSPRRLVAYGNSISAQKNGFFARICSRLSLGGQIHGENASVGGVGSLGLAALADLLIRPGAPGLAIVETSASDAAGATTLEDLPEVFTSLLGSLQDRGLRPVVVHLPRFDVSGTQLNAVRSVQDGVCASQGVISLNLEGVLTPGHTYDGVHLTDAGALVVGDRLLEELREELESPQAYESFGGDLRIGLIPCEDQAWTMSTGEQGTFRMIFPTRRYAAGELARVEFPGRAALGLVMVVGPSSGAIHLSGGEQEARVQLMDQWCTFRRLQVVHLPHVLRDEDSMAISLGMTGHADTDAWGFPSSQTHIGDSFEIIGLIARSITAECS